MENYDRHGRRNEGREQGRFEDKGRDRDSWWRARSDDDDPPRRERGWLDYDRDYGRSGERHGGRDEPRYGDSGRGGRSNFSPDWSREDEQPRFSDDQYYARNRQRGSSEDDSRRGGSDGRRGDDDRSRWEQRARSSVPREQRELAERSQRGDYYDPEWPYERSSRGSETQRAREDDEGARYSGYYRRSATPFSYAGGSGVLYSESLSLRGPHAGRGPKGYKRSDQQIVEDACQRLERDGEIDATEIEVSAEDGVIRLRGTVQDRHTKRRAEECVESIYGARDVMNELRVERGSEQSQGSQSTLGSQSGRGSQQSQGSQGASPQGTQGSPQGQRPSGGSPAPEQPGDEKRPRH